MIGHFYKKSLKPLAWRKGNWNQEILEVYQKLINTCNLYILYI